MSESKTESKTPPLRRSKRRRLQRKLLNIDHKNIDNDNEGYRSVAPLPVSFNNEDSSPDIETSSTEEETEEEFSDGSVGSLEDFIEENEAMSFADDHNDADDYVPPQE